MTQRLVLHGRTCAIAIAIGLMLSACGTRGALELPAEAKASQTTATAESGQGKAEGQASKPHKSFILDGLIR